MSDDVKQKPELTIVGGQPQRERRRKLRGKIKVPVGLEKLLFHAARDHDFRARLLADRAAAIEETGVRLRDSERAMLETVGDDELMVMIDNLVPENPRKRKFMGLVAAAATSLAAGTAALAGCDDGEVDNEHYTADAGIGPDGDVDGDTDTDYDMDAGIDAGDTDTIDTDMPTDTDCGGIMPDADVDGSFD